MSLFKYRFDISSSNQVNKAYSSKTYSGFLHILHWNYYSFIFNLYTEKFKKHSAQTLFSLDTLKF